MKDYIKEHFDITETKSAVEPKANRSTQWRKTESPMAILEPGKMRSDREPVPAGFTKDDADRAEIMEAAVSQRPTAAAHRLHTSTQLGIRFRQTMSHQQATERASRSGYLYLMDGPRGHGDYKVAD